MHIIRGKKHIHFSYMANITKEDLRSKYIKEILKVEKRKKNPPCIDKRQVTDVKNMKKEKSEAEKKLLYVFLILHVLYEYIFFFFSFFFLVLVLIKTREREENLITKKIPYVLFNFSQVMVSRKRRKRKKKRKSIP